MSFYQSVMLETENTVAEAVCVLTVITDAAGVQFCQTFYQSCQTSREALEAQRWKDSQFGLPTGSAAASDPPPPTVDLIG